MAVPAIPNGLPRAAYDAGAVAHWRLSETSGSFVDVVRGYALALTGSVTRAEASLLVEDADAAVKFLGGANGYLSGGALAFGQVALGFAFRWKSANTGAAHDVLQRRVNNTNYWTLRVTTAGDLQLNINGSNVYTSAAAGLNDGAAHSIALVRDGSTTRLYADGVALTTTAQNFATVAVSSGFALNVGANLSYSTTCAEGWIDELSVFHTVPSAAEIAALHACATAPKSVSGVVRDAAGALTSRQVLLARRSNGALVGSAVSDPTTGAFAIPTPYADEEHVRIVLDDAAGDLYNDLVDRVFPV